MRPKQILEENREAIEQLCQKYFVIRLRIFGSSLGSNWNNATSDFDFLVEYGPESRSLAALDRLVGLQMDLEQLLGRKVDAVDWNSARNPIFKQHADNEAEVFYAA